MAGNGGMENMVCSIINPYRIEDPMTYSILDWKYITCHLSYNNGRRVGLFQLSWGVMYFSIQDAVSHGIAPIQNLRTVGNCDVCHSIWIFWGFMRHSKSNFRISKLYAGCWTFLKLSCRQGVFLFCYFWNFLTSKCSLLDRKSNIAKSQFLKIWRSTSIRGRTSAQIKTLRPYFLIFSITVVRICLRKQQSKFFTNMLSTPSIEPVNIWFDPAATWSSVLQFRFPNKATKLTNASSWYVNLVNCQNKWEILLNFCGFIRKLDLYHTG